MKVNLYKKTYNDMKKVFTREMNVENKHELPKLEKVCVNIGLGKALVDKNLFEVMKDTLVRITGQRPVETRARKSIAGFKIRKGLSVGLKITLRRKRMEDFFMKLIKITLPRVRDFSGIDRKSVDEYGNLSIGFVEHTVFPEIDPNEVEKLHGLEVTVVTSVNDRKKALKFFELMGVPLKKEESEKNLA